MWRETPISALLPSYDPSDYDLLEQYLDEKIDVIYGSYSDMISVKTAFPILHQIFTEIVSYEEQLKERRAQHVVLKTRFSSSRCHKYSERFSGAEEII